MLERVYETIINWDEGGGKRSRRELAERIEKLYESRSVTPSEYSLVVAQRDWAFKQLKAVRTTPTLSPLAPHTGYYEIEGSRVWLEKDEPFPTEHAAPAEPVVRWRQGVSDDQIDAVKRNLGIQIPDHRAAEIAKAVLGAAPALPNPGSPEASAMIDSVLAEYNWPSNTKNAARAGYVAAARLLAAPAARPVPPPNRIIREGDLR